MPIPTTARIATCALAAACLGAQVSPSPSAGTIQARIRDAQQDLAGHRFKEAAEKFEAILNLDDGMAGAHANLGVARYLLGEYDRATSAFGRALELDPSMKSAELYLGLSTAKAGDVNRALPSLASGFWNATSDPWRLQAGVLLAEIYAARRQQDDLLIVVRELQRAFPRDPDVLYMAYRLYSDMGAMAISALVREAPGSARLHQVTAELLASEEDYPRAARQYREALRINPRLPGAHRGLALSIMNSNPDEAAIREAEQALQRELAMNPQDADSEYQLGEISWRRGDEESALKRYSHAVELQPEFTPGLIALGKALIAKGEYESAVQHLRDAIQADPENEVAHYRLAQAYRQLGRVDDASKELEEFRRIRSTAEALGAIYRQVQRSTIPGVDIESGAGP